MAGAGDLTGTGDEGEGEGKAIRSADILESEKEGKPAASTARTRQPPASLDFDIPGAGDLKGPGEEDEIKAIQIADVKAPRSEKMQDPAGLTKVSASCTREPPEEQRNTREQPEVQRKLTEERMAERYQLPVEVFRAGSSSGCALIGSIEAFQEAADTCRPFYVMPYLPPEIAIKIQSEIEKMPKARVLLMNPDLLASKVAVIDEMNAEIRLWDQEGPVCAQRYYCHVASELISFRSTMKNRLIFTCAAKGEWVMAHKYLKPLYPDSHGQARIEQIIKNLKCMYHCSGEGEVDDRIHDLISLLSMEDRTELLYKSQSLPTSEKTSLFKKVATEPSLIGATNEETTVPALKNLLVDLVSCAVVKGHLADETGSVLPSKDAVQKLRKDGQIHINGLITMLEKKTLNFVEMSSTINLLKQVATRVHGQGLETLCDAYVESCEKKNSKRCTDTLPKIEQEHIVSLYPAGQDK